MGTDWLPGSALCSPRSSRDRSRSSDAGCDLADTRRCSHHQRALDRVVGGVVHVPAELNELADVVVGDSINREAGDWDFRVKQFCLLVSHESRGDALVTDLEVDTDRAQTGIETLVRQIRLSDLETARQIVRQDGQRHIVSKPQPPDLDEGLVTDLLAVDGISDVSIEAPDRELQ